MSLPRTVLDNVIYEELLKEAISLIPVYAPEWTNHNPSDPGITLIELFAWLCEMIIYRSDQVTEKNYIKFLNLLGIKLEDGEDISSGIRRGVSQLSERTRAVTRKDYEILSYQGLMSKPGLLEKYPDIEARTICVVNRDLENIKNEKVEEFGHISIILIINTKNQKDFLIDIEEIKKYVKEYLYKRKLLTTHIHVVGVEFIDVNISLQVSAMERGIEKTIRSEVQKYLDPIKGGEGGCGWTQGRKLYKSDMFYIVERIPGVDHVIRIDLDVPDINPYELIRLKELEIEVES